MQSNLDEVKMNNDCFCNLHLTTAYGGASPQGEAFVGWHLNYTVFISLVEFAIYLRCNMSLRDEMTVDFTKKGK